LASIASAIIPAAINAGGSLAAAKLLQPKQPQYVAQPSLAESLGLGQIPTWGLILGGVALVALLMALTSRRY
jgi:hypothetical protein